MSDSKAATLSFTSIFATSSLCWLLTIIFVVLKLAGALSWSWLWVLSPIWILYTIIFTLFVGLGIIGLIATILD